MRSLVILAFCVVAFGLWLLGTGGEEAPPEASPPVEQANTSPAPEVAEQPEIDRAEIEDPAPVLEEGQFAYRVRVVREGSEQAVPYATVMWFPPDFDWGDRRQRRTINAS